MSELKILHLTLKKKWFDMIASGVKKEEYREIKEYWNQRFNKHYDAIHFRNGYSTGSPELTIELNGIEKSLGIIEWGAPENKPVYILKLGNILKSIECKMCKKPIWLPADREVHVLGITCGEVCEERYQDMRRDGHWR